MGWNTTVVILNDALHKIAEDPDFGKNVSDATLSLQGPPGKNSTHISSGYGSAAEVVEKHHADSTVVLAVGGNSATVLHQTLGWRHNDPQFQLQLLREMADKMGYTLRKKPQKRTK